MSGLNIIKHWNLPAVLGLVFDFTLVLSTLVIIVFFQFGLETIFGQELLPEAGPNETIGEGQNQTIGEPNTNATRSKNNPQPLPDQPLQSLY